MLTTSETLSQSARARQGQPVKLGVARRHSAHPRRRRPQRACADPRPRQPMAQTLPTTNGLDQHRPADRAGRPRPSVTDVDHLALRAHLLEKPPPPEGSILRRHGVKSQPPLTVGMVFLLALSVELIVSFASTPFGAPVVGIRDLAALRGSHRSLGNGLSGRPLVSLVVEIDDRPPCPTVTRCPSPACRT
jgi:hypothetical protein